MSADDPKVNKELAWEWFHRLRHEGGGQLITPEVRHGVMERSNWRCCYCGIRIEETKNSNAPNAASIEHIRRKADGGTHMIDNLAAACAWCNTNRQEFDAIVWFNHIVWLKAKGEHPNFKRRR